MSENDYRERLEKNKVKVCPVIIDLSQNNTSVLVFRHPLAGIQLVKGTVEVGENLVDAAIRELKEESGVSASSAEYLGQWETDYDDQLWFFFRCHTEQLPNHWKHFAADDGGHDFDFFWHDLDKDPDDDWHEVFQKALEWIRSKI